MQGNIWLPFARNRPTLSAIKAAEIIAEIKSLGTDQDQPVHEGRRNRA
jgi:hypothetical protein